MTDPREPAPETARLDAPTPPPGPWWSRPDDQWGAPQSSAGTRTAQPPYGAYGQSPSAPPAQEDPWRQPETTAVFGTGAPAWGYPTDTIGGRPEREDRKRGGFLRLLLPVVLTALLAGVFG